MAKVKTQENAVTKVDKTSAVTKTLTARFIDKVNKEFSAIVQDGSQMNIDQHQRQLVQHLFVGIDSSLKMSEAKRSGNNKPITWENVDTQQLAMDSVHAVQLGLDALVPNHVSIIPRWNAAKQKYDVCLQPSYEGQNYYRQKIAVDPPDTIIYELVRENDEFEVIKKDHKNDVEGYRFKITNPFDRGKVIGGFGYLVYKGDPTKNRIFLVGQREFELAKQAAKTKAVWDKYEEEMQFKTVVLRVSSKLPVDPRKINSSHAIAEDQALREMVPIDDTPKLPEQASSNEMDDSEVVDAEFIEEISANKDEPFTKTELPADDPGF